MTKRKWLS